METKSTLDCCVQISLRVHARQCSLTVSILRCTQEEGEASAGERRTPTLPNTDRNERYTEYRERRTKYTTVEGEATVRGAVQLGCARAKVEPEVTV